LIGIAVIASDRRNLVIRNSKIIVPIEPNMVGRIVSLSSAKLGSLLMSVRRSRIKVTEQCVTFCEIENLYIKQREKKSRAAQLFWALGVLT